MRPMTVLETPKKMVDAQNPLHCQKRMALLRGAPLKVPHLQFFYLSIWLTRILKFMF